MTKEETKATLKICVTCDLSGRVLRVGKEEHICPKCRDHKWIAPARECPSCGSVTFVQDDECPDCGANME